MASRPEVTVDRPVRGQELLGMAGGLEPLHLALPAPGWAMRVLRPVVKVAALPVLDVGQDLALGRAAALLAKPWPNLRHQRRMLS